MQRKIIHGVPYFTDKTNLYLWDESDPTPIGTISGDNITFKPSLISNLSDRLATWRTSQNSRVRKPTTTNSRKNRNNKATVEEVPEDDE
jgi:hypothetical protein